MRIERLLVHRCDLTFPSGDEPTGRDPYGRPIYEDRTETAVPCRLDQLRTQVATDDTGRDVVITNLLILGPELQPAHDMKVGNIRDKAGRTVVGGSFRVVSILPAYRLMGLNHYEVTLTIEGGSENA